MPSKKYVGPAEAEIQANILLRLGARPGIRLFRNHVGEGWQGQVASKTPDTVTLIRPRYVTFGLGPDTADLIGWCRGQFVSLEVKTPVGRPTPGQVKWCDAITAAGGIAGIVRSPDEADALLRINSK